MKATFVLLFSILAGVACAEPMIVVDLDQNGGKPGIVLMDDGVVLAEWPIAAPKRTKACLIRKGSVAGVVREIDHNAWWYPTDATKRAYLAKGKRLNDSYAPKDPKNALGGRKLLVDWDDPCVLPSVRIHGTIEPRHVDRRARVSRDCFRMRNEHWDELALWIGPGTRVLVVPDRT